jgi:hypothetical protein
MAILALAADTTEPPHFEAKEMTDGLDEVN